MRHFLVILLFTALAWWALAMSDYRQTALSVTVEMRGYDTTRYALVRADSAVTVKGALSGFGSLAMRLTPRPLVLVVDVPLQKRVVAYDDSGAMTIAISTSDLDEHLHRLLDRYGLRQMQLGEDTLRATLAQRGHRSFHPSLQAANFLFAMGYGLYGEPVVEPAEVTLYGDPALLAQVDRVGVRPVTVADIDTTASFRLALDPVWKARGDIRASSDSITVTLPVTSFVERSFSLPVALVGAPPDSRVRLYPDHVTLTAWVAHKELATVKAGDFVVQVRYDDILRGAAALPVRLARFPQGVRIRNLSTHEVKYVVMK